jgi:hypothetical protein
LPCSHCLQPSSNATNITDTSIVLVTFPLLNIRDQREDEDVIGPDEPAHPLPEGFSVAPRTAVNVTRYVDTALTPPTTKDYTGIHGLVIVTGDLHQADQFLLALLLEFQ